MDPRTPRVPEAVDSEPVDGQFLTDRRSLYVLRVDRLQARPDPRNLRRATRTPPLRPPETVGRTSCAVA
ncbi:hypothetical protein OG426_38935 [Streptomyces canus]|uniref:hypothetical protein n=1 Tax=Streptomyces canus TaxID=58343 RepID=UPI002253233F|nr:hypothetical protein [Streptomyces canus]MCX4856532.1 hypothetical protein [Streptomyces canus]WSW38003.1 hypothetical protein OG426_38935 [Streptomyces canus]